MKAKSHPPRAGGQVKNIIYLPRQLGGRASTCSGGLTEGVVIMSTYEEFMIIIAVASLIVSILNMKNKK